MSRYKVPVGQPNDTRGVLRFDDGEFRTFVPPGTREYVEWKAQGNVAEAADPSPPPTPDYGTDVLPPDQRAAAVSQLRDFLALGTNGLPAPTNAQVVGALKLVIRGLLRSF
jgi:hypothetical protein